MSSASNENVDPPDKDIVIINDIDTANDIFTDPIIKSKLSRNRSDDDDAGEFENDEKKMKTFEDFQHDPSKTLCRNSILDTNPFAILDSNEDTEDLAGKISKNINIKQFGANNHSAKNIQNNVYRQSLSRNRSRTRRKQFPTLKKFLKEKLCLKS